MGGKSTIMRQVSVECKMIDNHIDINEKACTQLCILVVMAQLGCYVPASSYRCSLFDRVFTRIGAQDNILAGQVGIYVIQIRLLY